jgi:hypothetical protein
VVRELYLDQNLTLERVIEAIGNDHGLHTSKKAFQRKLTKWGFMKNIPNEELKFMAIKGKRRLDEEGKETEFKRRCNTNSSFQDVAPDKIVAWLRKFGGKIDALDSNNPTPVNVQYATPTGSRANPSSGATPHSPSVSSSAMSWSPVHAVLQSRYTASPLDSSVMTLSPVLLSPFSESEYEERIRYFNELFQKVWTETKGTSRCFSFYRDARHGEAEPTSVRLQSWQGLDISAYLYRVDEARTLVFKSDYKSAKEAFFQCHDAFVHMLGEHHWLTIIAKFEATLMDLAGDASCSSSYAYRFLQECLACLNFERASYASLEDTTGFDLPKTLAVSQRLTIFWTQVVTMQAALKHLKGVLPNDHPQVRALQKNLDRKESHFKDHLYSQRFKASSYNQNFSKVQQRVFNATETEDLWQQTVDLAAHCAHVVSAEQAETLSRPNSSDPRPTDKTVARARHRVEGLKGAAFSFCGDHATAESLLSKVQKEAALEICPENKVHELLIYAEHKTREGEWHAMHELLEKACTMLLELDEFPLTTVSMFRQRLIILQQTSATKLTVDDQMFRMANSGSQQPYGLVPTSPVPSLATGAPTASSDSASSSSFISSDSPGSGDRHVTIRRSSSFDASWCDDDLLGPLKFSKSTDSTDSKGSKELGTTLHLSGSAISPHSTSKEEGTSVTEKEPDISSGEPQQPVPPQNLSSSSEQPENVDTGIYNGLTTDSWGQWPDQWDSLDDLYE